MQAKQAMRKLEEVSQRLHRLAEAMPDHAPELRRLHADLQELGSNWNDAYDTLQAIAELTHDYGYAGRVDADGKFFMETVTGAFSQVTGYAQEELDAAGGWPTLIHPDDMATVAVRQPALLKGLRDVVELRIITKSGETRWIRYLVQPVWDSSAGRVVRYFGAVQDVTASREAEAERQRLAQEFEREHATFEMVLKQMPACVAIIEAPTGRLVFINSFFERIFRYPAPPADNLADYVQFKGYHPDGRLLAPEEWPGVRAMLHGETVVAEDVQIERGDGTRGYIRANAGPVRDRAGTIIAAVVTFYDVTEELNAAATLQANNQRLQALSERLVHVQETERRAVAQELHDEVGQNLTGLKLMLETLSRTSTSSEVIVNEACYVVNQLMSQVRNLSLNLRPAMLDDLGLLPALLWLFQRYQTQTGIQVHFQRSGIDRRFRPEIETAAYRIVQEALNNVARHAGVREVVVRAWADEEMLGVQIHDRGKGFIAEHVTVAASSSGLSGMSERVRLLGGQLTVDSRPHEGTRLTAEFPLVPKQ